MALKGRKQFIVLLQGDSSGNENKYIKLLVDEGIHAKSLPTLSFDFVNKEILQNCLDNADCYSGVIFTSTRAVSVVSSVDSCMENWKNKNNFSVGRATADLAQSLLNLDTQGSDSGNSESLCQFIIEKCGLSDKPFLFPCSNIRKDTIPVTLSQNGLKVEEIICYKTVPNINFKDLWKNLIEKEGLPEILVFYSPSGVDSCINIVKDTYTNLTLPKFIAIGPSTEKALLEVDIYCKVAEKPTPESVVCVVKNMIAA